MTHEQRANHIAQLLTYRSHLECKLSQVEQEIADLISRQTVTASPQARRDAVGNALLEQRATMYHWSDRELIEAMLDGVTIDWKAAEFGKGT